VREPAPGRAGTRGQGHGQGDNMDTGTRGQHGHWDRHREMGHGEGTSTGTQTGRQLGH